MSEIASPQLLAVASWSIDIGKFGFRECLEVAGASFSQGQEKGALVNSAEPAPWCVHALLSWGGQVVRAQSPTCTLPSSASVFLEAFLELKEHDPNLS